ncbi:MAG: hypothetical protein BEU00_03280 [Marine Group III euryarchaeote CG-Epi3]|uniref:RCC1-like domain-containing protein n=1 Tax=Marine Group III euryarchaeote CG-Epi3 TaxID=1888997 RepID=A0A1J5UBK9_9ARCH|nr:MAG: hypothetical protein BEU00_03270 [Marine Group III euryarchaeote CG-Epi3]OIR23300.1 MAG: hypothetical protein BEU00_03280 [Marine Group III euryarchaeote CG-Epi3]
MDTDSYSSVVVEDSSILEELSEQNGARTGEPSNLSIPFTNFGSSGCNCHGTSFTNGEIIIFAAKYTGNATYGGAGKGYELHVTDGTLTGTSMIADLNPGDSHNGIASLYSNAPIPHVWWNDVLYLRLDDGTDVAGPELWRTDGTESGTYIVKDIREGSYSSTLSDLILWEDHIYFSANDGTNGSELWKSDGTTEGTHLVKDIYPGNQQDSSNPSYFTVFNDKLYFSAEDEDNGQEIWTTDGTENGTTLAVDVWPGNYGGGPRSMTVFNDYLYFSAFGNNTGRELWKSDLTENGTSLVKDIVPGSTGSFVAAFGPSNPSSNFASNRPMGNQKFSIMQGSFYFEAKIDNKHNIWKSDGTENGTVQVTNFTNNELAFRYRGGVAVGESKMAFLVDTEEHDEELWMTDGTTEGTHLVIDLNPDGDSDIEEIFAGSGDIFYFGAKTGNPCGWCEEYPHELWKTDGTEEGTIKVNSTSINGENPTGIGRGGNFLRFGDHLVFSGANDGDGNLWILHNVSSGFSPTPSYPLFSSVDSANLAINEPMENITFQYDLKSAGTLVNQNIGLASRSTCAIVENGSVACWGRGFLNTLGNGDTADSGEPILTASMPDNRSVVAIDAGNYNVCALLDNGSVACWGSVNMDGEMGNGDQVAHSVPELTNITGSELSATSISVAFNSACALLDNGSVSCWGDNQWGQVGDNSTIDKLSPTYTFPFADGKKAVAITSGRAHHCALLDDGTVSCWGLNQNGQLGDNSTTLSSVPTPTQPLGGQAIAISSNVDHTCAILDTGALVCWGKNDEGQVGTGSNSPDKILVPTLVNQSNWPSSRSAVAVGTGDDHTCAILDNNSVYCWGRNNAGQLGRETAGLDNEHASGSDFESLPTKIFGDNLTKLAIESHGDHSCVLIENGSIYCWGRQSHGQIGDGTASGSGLVNSPSLVATPYSFLTEDKSLTDSMANVTGATCSVSPELPTGLDIDRSTCTISGTPSVEISNINYTVTALINDNIYKTAISLSTYYIDSDGDGYLDNLDDFPDDINEWLDTDGDGIGNNADTDDDGDNLTDVQEQNSNPVTDSLDPDTDDDGYCDGPATIIDVCDATDTFPTNPNEWNDNDGDGMGDNEDPDDDNDNFLDVDEVANGTDTFDGCDPDENSTACDIDNDGLPKGEENEIGTNVTNPDTDEDGYCDGSLTVIGVCIGGDDFPLDAAAHKDTDGDGMPDTLNGNSTSDPALIEDLDDDNDGLNDIMEASSDPVTDSLLPDTDDDGFCDGPVNVTINDVLICQGGPDAFPIDPTEWLDTDGDGTGNNADTDDDGDGLDDVVEDANGNGTIDEDETNPLDPDTDDDGYCDGPVTIVDLCEAIDAFPTDETEWNDNDGDGTGDNADPDDDGDGYNDTADAFPLDDTEWFDTDEDGTGNNADPDDDGDGYNDTVEIAEGSDPLDIESIPLDTDGDFDPDSTDPDDDGDGYNDTDDVFSLDSSEWSDTDGDGIGNEEDTDDDGDGLLDTEEISLGSNPLVKDTDNDGIPDNFDPLPLDPNGDFDGDGKLDSEEYNPNSTTGNPADADGDGINDMLQGVASTNTTSDSGRSFDEFCWWFLLLLLLLLIPLLKRQYDNALIYTPHVVEYTIGVNEKKVNMKPSLHETAQKFREFTNRGKLRRVTYAISGNLVEGIDIDSKTGIISGHPKKVGTFTNEVVMKHSKGKFLGEVKFIITEKGKKVEKEEEPEPVLTSNPEPENSSSKPDFVGGAGTKMNPFVLSPAKGLEPGEDISSKQILTISGLQQGGIVNAKDLNSKDNGKRFSVVSEFDNSGKASSLKVSDDGEIKFRVNFNDDRSSTGGAEYEALMKLGTASVYVSWAVEVLKEESEPELEPEPEPEPKPVVAEKEVKKQEELERVKARSESIDFNVIGVATQSTLANEVEGGSSEVELADASEFENGGSATITDADGSETFTWKGKQGNQLTGVAGITRTFVAASIVVSKDDLQVIKGIGPFIEEKLNALGIYTYRQLANMTPDLEDQVNEAIEFFPGRVKRDQWVAQAKILIGEDAELDEKALKKAEDLDRVAAKAEGIDFSILGIASASDKDDLQVIKGIGPFIEEKLNALGIFKFSQIAKMTSEIEEEVNVAIEFFPGRVKRDEWVKQAAELAK